MNTLTKIITILLLAGAASVASASDKQLHFQIISAYLSNEQEKALESHFKNYIGSSAPQGAEIVFVNGDDGIVITEFTIPTLKKDKPRARLFRLKREWSALRQFFKENGAEQNASVRAGLIRTPEVLDAIALRCTADKSIRIAFHGSLVYESSNPAFNFIQGNGYGVPMKALGMTQGIHPFGCLEVAELGNDTNFFFVTMDEGLDTRWVAALNKFYNAYFQARKTNGLQSLSKDTASTLAAMSKTSLPILKRVENVDAELMQWEAPKVQLTISKPKPKPNYILLCDNSGSMAPMLNRVNMRIASMQAAEGHQFALIMFANQKSAIGRAAYLLTEGDNPSDIAEAFKYAKNYGGADVMQAMSTGLLEAKKLLDSRGSKNATIYIICDVAPKDAANTPENLTYSHLLNELGQSHKVVFINCNPANKTDWLPEFVTVEAL